MRRALIVDDHEDNLYLLRTLLTAHGFEVDVARDGQAALALADSRVPDIVVSDVLMPVMDGFTLCRRWREEARFQRVPFMIYTATYTDPRDEDLALRAGADRFLVKPIDPDVFLGEVERAIAGGHRACPPAAAPTTDEESSYLRQYSEALVRKLEDKLTALEAANRSLIVKERAIESAASGIALLDLMGRLSYANPALSGMLGRARETLCGLPVEEVLGEPAGPLLEAVRQDGAWRGEIVCASPSGPRVLEGMADTVRGEDGEPLCRILSLQDVTDRNRMMAEVQRGQRLAALSMFAGGVAHDFNNLLAALFGNIELARSTLPVDSAAAARLETASMAFERARDLARRLQGFAVGSPPRRRAVPMVEFLEGCCALALSGSKCCWQVTAVPGSEKATALADANQLSQVFTNMLVNASQAMPNGGRVTISVATRTTASGAPGSLSAGDYVGITVADEGPGIPADILPRVFDPFFTTKPSGTGLGLAMSYAIVREHGGRVSVASPPGAGAVFQVLLPAAPQDADVQRPSAHQPAPSDHGGARVLVMDDEPMIREMATRMLTRGGHRVVTAHDGADALARCDEAEAAGLPIDVAILDVTVPGGLGGMQVLARLREAHPDIAVILSTGYGDVALPPEDRAKVAVLPKPYQSHELLACTRAAIRDR